jgi:hypothetical protein
MKLIGVLCLSVLLVGCETPMVAPDTSLYYMNFYHGRSVAAASLLPYSGSTQVLPMPDPEANRQRMLQRGYLMLGYSSFSAAGTVDERGLVTHARFIGADIVLYRSEFAGSDQQMKPVLQYNPGQTSTTTSSGNVNATAYGSGGYAYGTAGYSGTSTTTTPGSFSTAFVPVTTRRYSHLATYWRKAVPPVCGAVVSEIPDNIMIKVRRQGVLVAAVVDDSPALKANIMEGDILLKVGGQEVSTPRDYQAKVRALAGQRVELEVLRGEQSKTIVVQFNQPEPDVSQEQKKPAG